MCRHCLTAMLKRWPEVVKRRDFWICYEGNSLCGQDRSLAIPVGRRCSGGVWRASNPATFISMFAERVYEN